jgi:SdrD B-like protein
MKRSLRVHVLYALLALASSACGNKAPSADRTNAPQAQPSSPASEQAASASGAGQITGFVFEDKNRNGVFDAGDNRLSGQVVLLTNRDRSQRFGSATTSDDGSFHFDQIAGGEYRVSLNIPEKFERTNDDSFMLKVPEKGTAPTVTFGIAATR